MPVPSPDAALLSAMTTEHFVMQSAIGTAVAEQQARASMYLYSVSGALLAFGLMAESPHLLSIVFAVLPMLFFVGVLTTLRLVDVSMESLQSFVTVARVREHYRTLGKPAAILFDKAHGRWPEGKTDSGQIIGSVLGLLTTAASMICCVNAFVGGAGLALFLVNFVDSRLFVAVVVGTIFALVQIVGFYRYQKWRIELVAKFAESAALKPGDEGETDHS